MIKIHSLTMMCIVLILNGQLAVGQDLFLPVPFEISEKLELTNSGLASVSVGERKLAGVAALHAPSTLPHFGGVANSSASPSVPLRDDLYDDSCPDDIWLHSIQYTLPTLPYRVLNDYDRGGARLRSGSMQTVVLENRGFKVSIYPTAGGKVASIWDKSQNKELLFDNPVFQPADLARLNAWTSGGIEWNWPRLGHSVFTLQKVYVAEVQTERGPLVRIYEFDREMNSTWQVDLFLPEDHAALFMHTRVTNTNPWPVDGYWWTNIGLKIDGASRVIYPADYAIMNGGAKGLYRADFPWTNDNGVSGEAVLGGPVKGRPDVFGTDHSFPANYYNARETFLRSNGVRPRAWMGLVNTSDGTGVLHAQSQELNGRKYWTWGNDPADVANMNRLSFCAPGADLRQPSDSASGCAGWYLEEQAGVAPTQSQTFPLHAKSSLEWTEAVMSFDMNVHVSRATNYSQVVAGAEAALDNVLPTESFLQIDQWLRSQSQRPVTHVMSFGSAFGALHEKLTNEPLSRNGALAFNAPVTSTERPWEELLTLGTFSKASLEDLAPQSFMVDAAWVPVLQQSGERYGFTYLHHLHLHIALRQNGQTQLATKHLQESLAMNNQTNVLGLLLANQTEAAWKAIYAAISLTHVLVDSHTVNLARDVMSAILEQHQRANDSVGVHALLQSLSKLETPIQERLRNAQSTRIASAWLALHEQRPSETLRLLNEDTWAVSTPTLLELWYDAQYHVEAEKLGRPLNAVDRVRVRRTHPPPPGIDFRGAT